MNVMFLKKIDGIVGRLAAACLPAARQREIAEPRRVLVIRPGGIGDAVLLAPALLGLRERHPQAEITVLAERRNGAVFTLCPAVDRVLLYDSAAGLREVLSGSYDVVVDTEQWHRLSAVVARLTGAPVTVGFDTNERARLFTHRIDYSHDDYEARSFLSLFAPLGVSSSWSTPFLSVPEVARSRAAELLAPLHAPPVVIFPGASIPERRWGAERYGAVAARLDESGVPVAVVGGKDDAAEGERILAGRQGLNLAGRTSLVETAAVLERCRLLLSGDSGVLHLAIGLGMPTVSLFGPGIQKKWGPCGAADRVLNLSLSCSPCTRFGTTPPCSQAARCMKEISVAQVLAAVEELLTVGSRCVPD